VDLVVDSCLYIELIADSGRDIDEKRKRDNPRVSDELALVRKMR
jgi:hypothetical protein